MPWTMNDERALNTHRREIERLERDRETAVAAVRKVLAGALGVGTGAVDEASVQALITYADTFRDALAPFDSGCREAVAEMPRPNAAQIARAYGVEHNIAQAISNHTDEHSA